MLERLIHGNSPDNQSIMTLMTGFGVFAVVVAAVIFLACAYFIYRYSASGHPSEVPFQRDEAEGALEVKFGIFALCTVIVLGLISVKLIWRMDSEGGEAEQKPDIEIVGHQWWWEIRYPQSGVVTANVACLPKGRKMKVAIRSADVVHDWWVPGLGRKMDAVPGRTNTFTMEANETGQYEGACNEFCGAQHAWMRILVKVVEPEEYQKWLEHEGQDAEPPGGESAQRGAQLFQSYSCASCHQIRGTDAHAHIGPDLTHLASRPTLFAGMQPYSRQAIKDWLRDPQKIKPGAYMPNFVFSDTELEDLSSYLDGLK